MRNILLTLSYDGTDFCGWQRQDKADGGKPVRTVQAAIEAALEKLHKRPVALAGSGRTDSGVHASSQAANFFSPIDSIPVDRYPLALNAFLPPDVRIHTAREVPEDFSARFSATSRTYRYFLYPGDAPLASDMRYVWALRRQVDVGVLNDMASVLHGEIDCATFAAAGDASLSTKRYIEHACFFPQGDKVVFEICANAFLWKMVRSLTGTLVSFEKEGKGKKEFAEALFACDRSKAGPTAPPQGLFLWNVSFSGVRRHV
ncbi:MAG: tRNA pseudouridine(38-40) synthase TruA [Treponema sp.]|nr:tRNA pseudouridine(38-40) synthase TruA [Treponema sp.]